jgi:hypothetical protein
MLTRKLLILLGITGVSRCEAGRPPLGGADIDVGTPACRIQNLKKLIQQNEGARHRRRGVLVGGADVVGGVGGMGFPIIPAIPSLGTIWGDFSSC